MDLKTIILFMALAAVTAIPTQLDLKNKTSIEVLIRKGVVGFLPIVIRLDENFDPKNVSGESTHKIQKRAFTEELTKDILDDFEGVKEDDLTGLDRRIKTLPSWVG